MAINQMLLPEFDQEMASCRKLLERIPDDKLDWRPHEKSYSIGELATHLANLPHWGLITVTDDSFDMAPAGGEPVRDDPVTSAAEAVAVLDKKVAAARAAIAGASDEALMSDWSLLSGGQALFTLPKIAVLRTFVLNHMIHHRAQLGVCLRMNDVALPAIYGPTADESPQM